MASVTQSSAALPLPSAPIRIEPPRGLFELRLREVWAYRELLYFFVWRDVKIRYKQTVIGVLWVVIQPVLTMLIFTLFFGRLAKLAPQGLPAPVFYFAALVPWTYFAYALQMTTNVVVDNQRLITKVYFPRLILPISAALSGLVDFAIGFVVLAIFCFAYAFSPLLPLSGCLRYSLSRSSRLSASACGSLRSTPSIATFATSFRSSSSLDVCFAGGVSKYAGAGALALALRPQPHGRCH